MTISDKYKFIFVEVGSTGSTAIRRQLKPLQDTKIIVQDGFNHSLDSDGNAAHIPIWALKNDLPTEEFFKFGFFRNPWEVAVSKFFFHEGYDVVKSHRFPRDTRVHTRFSGEFNEWAQAPGFLDAHYESKTKSMWDMVAKGDTILVDKIYDYKYLHTYWIEICEKIGIPHKILENTKTHKGAKQHYSKYYTDKTIEIVREQFSREIEYFGYEFEDQR